MSITCLVLLIVEVLDCLVVDQAVHRLVSSLIVRLVHGHPELSSPLGEGEGEHAVHDHGGEGHPSIGGTTGVGEDAADDAELQHGGDNIEDQR